MNKGMMRRQGEEDERERSRESLKSLEKKEVKAAVKGEEEDDEPSYYLTQCEKEKKESSTFSSYLFTFLSFLCSFGF